MSSTSTPGSLDYFQQLNDLKKVPVAESSIKYLSSLINNPSSPFQKWLVDGRREQIMKALTAQKGQQAKQGRGGM